MSTWLDDMLVGEVDAGIGRAASLADPYGFGQDLDCEDDLTSNMGEIAGVPVLFQDLLHRLITPRGSLTDDPNYGTDAREDVSRGMTPAELAALPGKYAAELQKDDRIHSIDVQIESQTSDTLRVTFVGEGAQGPFRFTADITAAGALVVEASQ